MDRNMKLLLAMVGCSAVLAMLTPVAQKATGVEQESAPVQAPPAPPPPSSDFSAPPPPPTVLASPEQSFGAPMSDASPVGERMGVSGEPMSTPQPTMQLPPSRPPTASSGPDKPDNQDEVPPPPMQE